MQAISLESLECIELQRRRHEGDCHISGKASNSVTHETQSLVASCDPESYASKRPSRGRALGCVALATGAAGTGGAAQGCCNCA